MTGRDGVIVIGATNRLQDIHPALLRPSRLERAIYVGPPDQTGTERILRHHLADDLAGIDLSMLAALNVARQATGAVIEEQVRAARRAARRAKRPMSLDDLRGQVADEDHRSPEMLYRSAVHEAGHALAGLLLETGALKSVSLYRIGGASGLTHFEDSTNVLITRTGFERLIMRLLGGRAAEEIVLGEASQGAGGSEESDLGLATSLATALHASVGLGDSLIYRASPSDAPKLLEDPLFRRQVDATLGDLYARTLDLVRSHKAVLLSIAGALLGRRFLTDPEVTEIMSGQNESAQADSQLGFGETG